MSLFIKNALIADPESSYNGRKVNLLIENKKIAAIGAGLEKEAARLLDLEGDTLSPGWVDVLADYCDPGYEHFETLETGIKAAAAGGFTDVMLTPNTDPVVATHSVVDYLRNKTKGSAVNIHILGAVSKDTEGKEIAEMLDMRHSGAVAFTDGWHTLQNAGLMMKALEYTRIFDGIIIQVPDMTALSEGGLMNESENSVRFGIAGIPDIAESILVYRDIELARYADSRIHFSGISTKKSLDLIKSAKKNGVKVSCSVTPYHLLFSDRQLEGYDSLYKVNPPLRSEKDRKALIAALEDGTIDCIATHHAPKDWDAKVKELEYALPGMAIQEVTWNALLKAAPKLSDEQWAGLLSVNPRKIFGLKAVTIEEGAPALLTRFNRTDTRVFDHKESLGYNVPFWKETITGSASIIKL